MYGFMDPDDERLYKIASVFNPNSAKILDYLKEGPKYKIDIEIETGLTGEEIVSRMSDLERYDIVSHEPSVKGEETLGYKYSLNEEKYQEVLGESIELLGEDLEGDELTKRLKKLADNIANHRVWNMEEQDDKLTEDLKRLAKKAARNEKRWEC